MVRGSRWILVVETRAIGLLINVGMTGIRGRVSFVHFLVPAQVGNNRKMTPAAFNVAGEWLLARVAVHVCLQRAGSCKALVADFALVLLLGVG